MARLTQSVQQMPSRQAALAKDGLAADSTLSEHRPKELKPIVVDASG